MSINTKKNNVIDLTPHLKEPRDKARRHNIRRKVGGAAMVLAAFAGIGFGAKAGYDATIGIEKKEAAAAAAAADAAEARNKREVAEDALEAQRVAAEKNAAFHAALEAAIAAGEVKPEVNSLIVYPGVRVYENPGLGVDAKQGEEYRPTNEFRLYSHPIIYDGKILEPGEDGAFRVIDTEILGQTDDTTGNPYTQWVPPASDSGDVFNLTHQLVLDEGNGFSMRAQDGGSYAVATVTPVETIGAAMRALGYDQ